MGGGGEGDSSSGAGGFSPVIYWQVDNLHTCISEYVTHCEHLIKWKVQRWNSQTSISQKIRVFCSMLFTVIREKRKLGYSIFLNSIL
jgi:hypothetical protein